MVRLSCILWEFFLGQMDTPGLPLSPESRTHCGGGGKQICTVVGLLLAVDADSFLE